MNSRRVYCRECKREVPAFEALLQFTREFERFIDSRDQAKREANKASEELADIKRQVINAKAQMRRTKAKEQR